MDYLDRSKKLHSVHNKTDFTSAGNTDKKASECNDDGRENNDPEKRTKNNKENHDDAGKLEARKLSHSSTHDNSSANARTSPRANVDVNINANADTIDAAWEARLERRAWLHEKARREFNLPPFSDRKPDLTRWKEVALALNAAARSAVVAKIGYEPSIVSFYNRAKVSSNVMGIRPTIRSFPEAVCVQLLQLVVKDEADIWPGTISYDHNDYRKDDFAKMAENRALEIEGVEPRPERGRRSRLFALCAMADGTRVDIQISNPEYELWVNINEVKASEAEVYCLSLATGVEQYLARCKGRNGNDRGGNGFGGRSDDGGWRDSEVSKHVAWRCVMQNHFVDWTPSSLADWDGVNEDDRCKRASVRYCVLGFPSPDDMKMAARAISGYGIYLPNNMSNGKAIHLICEERIDLTQKANDTISGVSIMDWIVVSRWVTPQRYYTHAQVEIEVLRSDISRAPQVEGFAPILKLSWDIETMSSTSSFPQARTAGDFCIQINSFVWPHGVNPGADGSGGINLMHHLGYVAKDSKGNVVKPKDDPRIEFRPNDPPLFGDDCAPTEIDLASRWRDTMVLDVQADEVIAWNNDGFDNGFLWYRSQGAHNCAGRIEEFEEREEQELVALELQKLKASGVNVAALSSKRAKTLSSSSSAANDTAIAMDPSQIMQENAIRNAKMREAAKRLKIPEGTFPSTVPSAPVDYAQAAISAYGSYGSACVKATENAAAVREERLLLAKQRALEQRQRMYETYDADGNVEMAEARIEEEDDDDDDDDDKKQKVENEEGDEENEYGEKEENQVPPANTTRNGRKRKNSIRHGNDNDDNNDHFIDNNSRNNNDNNENDNNSADVLPAPQLPSLRKLAFQQRESDLEWVDPIIDDCHQRDALLEHDWKSRRCHFDEVRFLATLRSQRAKSAARREKKLRDDEERDAGDDGAEGNNQYAGESQQRFGSLVGKIEHRGSSRFPYLSVFIFERCELSVNDRSSPGTSKLTRHYELEIDGRLFYDLMHYVKGAPIEKQSSYSLSHIPEAFFPNEPRLRKIKVPPQELWDNWFEGPEARSINAWYAARDCLLPANIEGRLLGYSCIAEMARLARTSLQHVASRGITKRVMNLIIRYCHERNYVINQNGIERSDSEDNSYDGGNVLAPESGLYKSPIYTGDFTSLYPSIMEMLNLCYSTGIRDQQLRKRLLRESVVVPNAAFDAPEIQKPGKYLALSRVIASLQPAERDVLRAAYRAKRLADDDLGSTSALPPLFPSHDPSTEERVRAAFAAHGVDIDGIEELPVVAEDVADAGTRKLRWKPLEGVLPLSSLPEYSLGKESIIESVMQGGDGSFRPQTDEELLSYDGKTASAEPGTDLPEEAPDLPEQDTDIVLRKFVSCRSVLCVHSSGVVFRLMVFPPPSDSSSTDGGARGGAKRAAGKTSTKAKAPHVHMFVQNERGILPSILTMLKKARKQVRAEQAKHKKGSVMWEVLEARQLAIKTLANTVYGFTGALERGVWGMLSLAETTTGTGFEMIEFVKFVVENDFDYYVKLLLVGNHWKPGDPAPHSSTLWPQAQTKVQMTEAGAEVAFVATNACVANTDAVPVPVPVASSYRCTNAATCGVSMLDALPSPLPVTAVRGQHLSANADQKGTDDSPTDDRSGRRHKARYPAKYAKVFRQIVAYGRPAVIYGDTDSNMVSTAFPGTAVGMYLTLLLGDVTMRYITAMFPECVMIILEKLYYPYLVQKKKKRYAGYKWDAKIDANDRFIAAVKPTGVDARGIESRRRDNWKGLRDVFDAVLDSILAKRDLDQARKISGKAYVSLVRNDYPLHLYQITKGLNKDYKCKTMPAHAIVRNKIAVRAPGAEPSTGDRVAYVITMEPRNALINLRADDPAWIEALPKSVRPAIDRHYYVTSLTTAITKILELCFEEASLERVTSIAEMATRSACNGYSDLRVSSTCYRATVSNGYRELVRHNVVPPEYANFDAFREKVFVTFSSQRGHTNTTFLVNVYLGDAASSFFIGSRLPDQSAPTSAVEPSFAFEAPVGSLLAAAASSLQAETNCCAGFEHDVHRAFASLKQSNTMLDAKQSWINRRRKNQIASASGAANSPKVRLPNQTIARMHHAFSDMFQRPKVSGIAQRAADSARRGSGAHGNGNDDDDNDSIRNDGNDITNDRSSSNNNNDDDNDDDNNINNNATNISRNLSKTATTSTTTSDVGIARNSKTKRSPTNRPNTRSTATSTSDHTNRDASAIASIATAANAADATHSTSKSSNPPSKKRGGVSNSASNKSVVKITPQSRGLLAAFAKAAGMPGHSLVSNKDIQSEVQEQIAIENEARGPQRSTTKAAEKSRRKRQREREAMAAVKSKPTKKPVHPASAAASAIISGFVSTRPRTNNNPPISLQPLSTPHTRAPVPPSQQPSQSSQSSSLPQPSPPLPPTPRSKKPPPQQSDPKQPTLMSMFKR